MAKREPKAWITVNGVHVPIFEGESKEDAVKRSISKAKENARANEDQKAKDIARNNAEKNQLNNKSKYEQAGLNESEVKEYLKNNPDARREANMLLKEGRDFDEATIWAYKAAMHDKEKDKLNEKSDTGKYVASVGNSKIYKDGDNYISDINGKKVSSDNLDRLVYTLKQNSNREQESGYFSLNDYKEAYMKSHPGATSRDAFEAFKRDEPINSKGSSSDSSVGKSNDNRYVVRKREEYEKGAKSNPYEVYDTEKKKVVSVGSKAIAEASAKDYNKSKGSLSDASAGKASDEARVNKNIVGVRKEFSHIPNHDYEGHRIYKVTKNDYVVYKDGEKGTLVHERTLKDAKAAVDKIKSSSSKVPASFAANYPNLSGSQLKAKYEEYLKKNRK